MGLFRSGEDRSAARAAKAERARRLDAALDDYITRAAQAADRGDIGAEERALASGWKWVGEADNAWGGLRHKFQGRIQEATSRGRIRRSPYLGFAGDLHFWKDRVVADDGVRLMDEHVKASLETAGELLRSKRPTLTRMAMGAVLPGTALIPGLAFQKTEIKDMREVFFIVEHPEWHRMLKVDPQYTEGVRQLVLAVNEAAREHGLRSASAVAPQATTESESPLDQLKKLGQLRDAAVLTESEFEEQKARLLRQLNEG